MQQIKKNLRNFSGICNDFPNFSDGKGKEVNTPPLWALQVPCPVACGGLLTDKFREDMNMKGKEKCRALKEIRRQIAEENDIPYAVSQCTYQGDCRGTCPKCESELRYLERELAIRQSLGKAVAVVGISASVCAGLTACSPMDMVREQTAGEAVSAPGWEEELEGEATVEEEVDGLMPEPEAENGPGEAGETGENRESEETGEAKEAEGSGEAGETKETGETEEIVMGEILPPEETESSEVQELAGDIVMPEEGWETEEGITPSEEPAP